MAKFVRNVCGYVHKGDATPDFCPICKAPTEKFTKQEDGMSWVAGRVVNVAQGVPEDAMNNLRVSPKGECSKVGMYLTVARIAHREGCPEIGMYHERAAYEEAEHAAEFAGLLGEMITDSAEKNLEMRVDAEDSAAAGKFGLARRTKALNLDAIHDTVHEAARDEVRHGRTFKDLLDHYLK